MDKYGIMSEKELMAFVNHFSIEPFSNIHRYVILSLALCKDEPKKRNKYMVGFWNGCEHEAIKGTYRELCRECDGDISKMIERCKEDEQLRVVVFSYAFHSLLVPLMMGLEDAKRMSETDSSNE